MIVLIDYDFASTAFNGDIAAAIKLFKKEVNKYIRLECRHHRAGSFTIDRMVDDSLAFNWLGHNNRSLNY
jgi:hypothetical protein